MSDSAERTRLRVRWAVAAVSGVLVGACVTLALGLAGGLLAGWATLALVSLAWTLLEVWPMDAAETRDHATSEDPGRQIARIIAILGSLVSLAAVGVVIVQARNAAEPVAALLAGIAVLSVVASWALIQTNYLLHYARVYYEPLGTGEPARGIDFNQDEDPCYSDFAYFSVGLGMTYQVSDTNITRNAIRRIVIAQTMLAYLFGAGIIATVINLIAGLG